ncbi:MAG TPA: hypothetical protein VKM55_13685 [Candidatus Lokiarchaeia archaeon]|nr:hypothetical protein [Candidatus Lokiarchaeia archaeon]
MSRSVEKKVRKEDKLDDVILLPVDNIVPMDRLRKKARKYRQERDEAVRERDDALRKVKELQDELDRINSDKQE